MTVSQSTISPEQRLWQSVLYRAVMDATDPDPGSDETIRAKRDALSWLRGGGKDYRKVCSLAGVDPDFIRDAFLAGRINRDLLKAAEKQDGGSQ